MPDPAIAAEGARAAGEHEQRPGQGGGRLSRCAEPAGRRGARQEGCSKRIARGATCRAGRAGASGPDLSGINNKTKEELLTSILNPSFAIEPRFVNYIVTTKDGRMYDGVIANETPGPSHCAADRKKATRPCCGRISPRSALLRCRSCRKSWKNLSKQDLADVIAYLRGGL